MARLLVAFLPLCYGFGHDKFDDAAPSELNVDEGGPFTVPLPEDFRWVFLSRIAFGVMFGLFWRRVIAPGLKAIRLYLSDLTGAALEGKMVQICHLKNRPDLNGQVGRAGKYDPSTQRISVKLDDGAEASLVSVRYCNLEIVAEADKQLRSSAPASGSAPAAKAAANMPAPAEDAARTATAAPQAAAAEAPAAAAVLGQAGVEVATSAAPAPASAPKSATVTVTPPASAPAPASAASLSRKGKGARSAAASAELGAPRAASREPVVTGATSGCSAAGASTAPAASTSSFAVSPVTASIIAAALPNSASAKAARASTELVKELAARRKELMEKNLRNELEANDVIKYSTLLSQRFGEMKKAREEIARKHQLCHSRIKREKRNVGKISSLISQGQRLEEAAEEFNINVEALNGERDWLHNTEAWKGIMREFNEKWVVDAAGNLVASREQLAQDEEECGSFEDLLAAMKAEQRNSQA